MITESQSLPASIELYAKLTMLKMDGWCQPEKAIALAKCVLDNKPRFAVEIGVWGGRSLIAVALAMKEVGSGKIVGIDAWDPKASIEGFTDANRDWWSKVDHEKVRLKCVDSIVKTGVQSHVELIQATNKDALPMVQRINKPIDLLSIDGNHSPEQSCFDVENYVPMVPSGGFIFFDDADWDQTQEAVRRMMEQCTLKEIVGNCAVFVKR